MKRLLLLASSVVTQRSVMLAGRALDLAVVSAADLADAMRAARGSRFAAGLMVVQDTEGDVHAIRELLEQLAPSPVMLLASEDHVARALDLMGLGFADVTRLPLHQELLRHRLKQLLLRGGPARPHGTAASARSLLGDSQLMEAVRHRLAKLAATDLPVAIYGESGTGKELAARTIHAQSSRSVGPFVVANCAAMPESLFENELFGHERGSYTGAVRTTGGLVEEATGGTLVLDEIGELTLPLQAKLLRFLQFGTYRRVGGTRELRSDARVIAVTNRYLPTAVAEKTFRVDLYYRIHLLHVVMPSLRDRPDDLQLLVEATCERFCRAHDRAATSFTDAAIARLQQHDWPGNVRELEGVVQTTLALNDSTTTIGPDQVEIPRWDASAILHPTGSSSARQPVTLRLADEPLPAPFIPLDMGDVEGASLSEAKQRIVEAFEVNYLTRILTGTRGNVAEAARQAGTDRKTLWRLLRKHGIDAVDFKRRQQNQD